MSDRKLITGIEGLDSILIGGIPARTVSLIYGPPFVGKEHFVRTFASECLRHGIPAIFVIMDVPSTQLREEMTAIDKNYKTYEKNGLVRYVDAYSMSIGITEKDKYAEYIPNAIDLAAINLALNRAQQAVMGKHTHHLIILDSLTTLLANTNSPTVFRFTQVMKGRCKMAGATTVFTMGSGIHPDSDVQLFRGIMDGVIEFKEDQRDAKTYLKVQGFGDTRSRNWVEYNYEKGRLEVTGAFEIGRIR
jgi:circadian clock protein KaiC